MCTNENSSRSPSHVASLFNRDATGVKAAPRAAAPAARTDGPAILTEDEVSVNGKTGAQSGVELAPTAGSEKEIHFQRK